MLKSTGQKIWFERKISVFRKFKINFFFKLVKFENFKKIKKISTIAHLIQNTTEMLKSTKYIINRFVKIY